MISVDTSTPPLVVHVIYRLAVGGLENGLVNLINQMPREHYRHAIVCIDDYTDFRRRIQREDVEVYSLNKRPGQDWGLYLRLWRLFSRLKPDIVHTRNLAAMEAQLPAWLAGVPGRVHSEHGREGADLDGKYTRYNLLRRIFRRFIHTYIPLSKDLETWLSREIGVAPANMTQIYNGVDTTVFHAGRMDREALWSGFRGENIIAIGTVGRLAQVKDQVALVRAFTMLYERRPELRNRIRLVLVGDGPHYAEILQMIASNGLQDVVWLAGSRSDIPGLLRCLEIFALPSLSEGISNTILEAMATGLPVVATQVGGNPELVDDTVTGMLVPPAQPEALAEALYGYIADPLLIQRHGSAGRCRVVQSFSMQAMIERYAAVYDTLATARQN